MQGRYVIVGKLVRDKIPEIMRSEGRNPEVEQISGERLRIALKDKLVEEANELLYAEDITEELADVLEVAEALMIEYRLDPGRVDAVRADKRASRGGFASGRYLIR